LGIPTISERVRQAMVKMVLEPEWEGRFEPNSYGFRPGRSCHDAREAIYIALNCKVAYVLDADISGCFDNIDQTKLLQKLKTTTLIRKLIKGWLKSGVMEHGIIKPTEAGTPQGGIISPLLANIALHGLENYVKETLSDDLIKYCKKFVGSRSRKTAMQNISIILITLNKLINISPFSITSFSNLTFCFNKIIPDFYTGINYFCSSFKNSVF